ncbi:MAG: hypothetical protein KDB53_10360 [Planctomycetes bacterium]|nr:hypothetical protein [Planctomycetota bacterium]
MLLGRLPNALTLDSKGRLVIPARMRDEIVRGDKSPDLHLGYLLDRCLYLHTEEMHAEFVDGFAGVVSETPVHRKLKTKMLSRFFPVGLDNAGRITIPASLIEWAGIQKEVVVVCMKERIELWAKEVHEELERADQEEFEESLEAALELASRKKQVGETRGHV